MRWGVVSAAAFVSAFCVKGKPDRVDLAALMFFGWCALTVWWAPDHRASLDSLAKLGSLLLIFAALRGRDPKWAVLAGLCGTGAAALLGANYGGFGNPEFLAEFLLISMPLIPWRAAAMSATVLLATPSLLALPVALAAGAVTAWRFDKRAGLVAGSLGIAVAVLVVSHSVEAWTGIGTRLDLWAGTLSAWLDAPLFGNGFGSFVYVYPFHAGAGSYFGLIPYSVESATYANAAHNDALQLLMETGTVGLALGCWLIWEASRRSELRGLVALGIAGLLACIGFPLQNPATAMLVALVAARVSPPRTGTLKAWPVAVVGTVALGFVLWGYPPKLLAQAELSAARRYLDPEIREQKASEFLALQHANNAYQLDPANFRARLTLFETAAAAADKFAVPREQIDTAYAIAKTASPADTAILLARIGYLIRSKDCRGECDQIMQVLLRTASRKQEVARLVEGVR